MYTSDSLRGFSSYQEASASIKTGRGKALGIISIPGGVSGTIRLLDGGASGTEIFKITTKSSDVDGINYTFPCYLLFSTSLYLELTNTKAVVFYD